MLQVKKINLINVFIMVALHSFTASLMSMFPTNMFRTWDINLRPPIWHNTKLQWTNWAEIGYKTRGYNAAGNEVNVLQTWNDTQDALAMLKGFDDSSDIAQFLNDLGNPEDDGIRGHFKVTGNFKARGFGLALRYHAPHHITINFNVPFYDMSLRNVVFADQTRDFTSADVIVKEELTSQLQTRLNEFDPTLNIHGWSRVGFGDAFCIIDWYRNFKQGKPILKNVALNARLGLSVPSGKKIDINDICPIPYGFDGSVGVLFGGGIDLIWLDVLRGGIDVEFLNLFGTTRERRIKIKPEQTEFLLLAKARAHKDFGFTQRFNLFLEAHEVYYGLSGRATYQFWKHGDDKLTLETNKYSNAIANSAISLQEWTIHQVIFQISYDCQKDVADQSWFKPQLSCFYKLPFNGQLALLSNTYGGTLSFSF